MLYIQKQHRQYTEYNGGGEKQQFAKRLQEAENFGNDYREPLDTLTLLDMGGG